MNRLSSPQELLKRRWEDRRHGLYRKSNGSSYTARMNNGVKPPMKLPPDQHKLILGLSATTLDNGNEAAHPPAVTVVLEDRSICHRISLNKHASYESFAMALRNMLVDDQDDYRLGENGGLDLSNAVPGYLVAYEDMDDDLLLAGDLIWKDFVRVVKRIRLIPAKKTRRRPNTVEAKSDV